MKIFTVVHDTVRRRYYISFHDGVQVHKDGSPFYDLRIVKNKKDLKLFTNKLLTNGYKERMS